jgi:hypothetical protein
MIAPFDIFRVEAPNGILWIEAVPELKASGHIDADHAM